MSLARLARVATTVALAACADAGRAPPAAPPPLVPMASAGAPAPAAWGPPPPTQLPSAPPAAPPAPPLAPAASGPPPGAPACAEIADCETCASRPDCALCTYMRACVSTAALAAGVCNAEAIRDRADCTRDPVNLRKVEAAKDAAERRKWLSDQTRGMTLTGPPIETKLDKLSTLEIAVPAGKCNFVLFGLAPDAKPGPVEISIDFETKRSVDGGRTAFDTNTRVQTSGLKCSTLPGKVRFRVVDRFTYAPVASAGTGGISFALYTRARTSADPDDVGAGLAAAHQGPVGVDCQDCTWPCESNKTACENDCFRSDRDGSFARQICDRTCEQMYRACLRGCGACN